ncbi:hypothetical protein ACNQ2O_00380 [Mycoplasma sp. AA7A]|uniref:hypothetical protein n=1 Tax=unclassified Mycoplasma TaxID=2683645 RepID=UPI003AAEAF70
MKINFKSIIKPVFTENGEEKINEEAIQIIEFDAPVNRNWNDEEQAVELIFKEPKYNETNRIDIYDSEAWVYTNQTTVQIKHNAFGEVNVTFLDPKTKQLHELNMRTYCSEFIKGDNKYEFKYFICAPDNNSPASYFDLTLTLSE